MRGPRRALAAAALVVLLSGCGSGVEAPAAPRAEAPAPAALPGSPNARRDVDLELREDLVAPRHASDGAGHAWLEPVDGHPAEARAGEPGRFPVTFEAGPEGVAVGGSVHFQAPAFWGWSTPQVRDPEAPGFTRVTTDADGVQLEARTVGQGLLVVTVRGRPLVAGEHIHFDYGAGPAGALADRFAERRSRFHVAVDGDGDGVRGWLADAPALDVAPGPPAQLVAFLPSSARPGARVRLSVAALDATGSSGVALEGALALSLPAGLEGPTRLALGPGARVETSLRAARSGVFRVRVRGPGGLEVETNPLVVDSTAPPVRWADLHGHSQLSDGTGTPDDWYRYARDVADLDAAALTDHDHWGIPFLDGTPAMWDEIRAAVARYDEPGRFVTLLGFEWTSWIWGHRHVLYFGEDGEVLSSLAADTDTPQELWAALRGRPALTFAHHSAGLPIATDWTIAPDPELEPVTEIASVHGSSEAPDAPFPVRGGLPGNWVRDALGRGYRLGFIGSGDSHDGHAGLVQLAGGRGGLAALITDDLTREGLRATLRARRCYATNGPRIFLDARLDGEPPGARLPAGRERRLTVRVVGTDTIAAVEAVAGGEVVLRSPGAGLAAREARATWAVPPQPAGAWLYVRVLQADDGAAWSSPFFFE